MPGRSAGRKGTSSMLSTIVVPPVIYLAAVEPIEERGQVILRLDRRHGHVQAFGPPPRLAEDRLDLERQLGDLYHQHLLTIPPLRPARLQQRANLAGDVDAAA